jgi:hypothetical protein
MSADDGRIVIRGRINYLFRLITVNISDQNQADQYQQLYWILKHHPAYSICLGFIDRYRCGSKQVRRSQVKGLWLKVQGSEFRGFFSLDKHWSFSELVCFYRVEGDSDHQPGSAGYFCRKRKFLPDG